MPAASEVFAAGMLAGRVALVTGGGTGLGRAAAAELVACGASVVIAGRRPDVLAATAAEVGATCVAGDVRDPGDAVRIVKFALERFGRLDALVNNAGGQYFVPAEAIEPKGWRAVWRLNIGGTELMSRVAVERALRPAGGGTIVNVTLSPHHGMPGMAHSSAARAAVEGCTRAQARAWAADRIAVVALAAGHFDTASLRQVPRGSVARRRAQRPARAPRSRGRARLARRGRVLAPRPRAVGLRDHPRRSDNWLGPWPPPALTDEQGTVPTEERPLRG